MAAGRGAVGVGPPGLRRSRLLVDISPSSTGAADTGLRLAILLSREPIANKGESNSQIERLTRVSPLWAAQTQ